MGKNRLVSNYESDNFNDNSLSARYMAESGRPENTLYYDLMVQGLKMDSESAENSQLLFCFSNVSAKKHLKQELIINYRIKIMFASISHEFRTPINSIQNSLMHIKQVIACHDQKWANESSSCRGLHG